MTAPSPSVLIDLIVGDAWAYAAEECPPKAPSSHFLIGAHPLLQRRGLITRYERFFRDQFQGLKVIVPRPV